MSKTVIAVVCYVIFFHLSAFVYEVFLWMNPAIYEFALSKLDAKVDVVFFDQALILKTLFVNQGFYNLLVASGGIIGLWLYVKGFKTQGITLMAYMCFIGTGAGLVLLFTSTAYIVAALQFGSGFIGLILMYRNGLFVKG